MAGGRNWFRWLVIVTWVVALLAMSGRTSVLGRVWPFVVWGFGIWILISFGRWVVAFLVMRRADEHEVPSWYWRGPWLK
jgi:hypothetical protein